MQPHESTIPTAERTTTPDATVLPRAQATSPQSKKPVRPGWKPTIVRKDSFRRLRAIQKSTTDPILDLSYLSDACIQIALELGAEEIVRRAMADLKPRFRQP